MLNNCSVSTNKTTPAPPKRELSLCKTDVETSPFHSHNRFEGYYKRCLMMSKNIMESLKCGVKPKLRSFSHNKRALKTGATNKGVKIRQQPIRRKESVSKHKRESCALHEFALLLRTNCVRRSCASQTCRRF